MPNPSIHPRHTQQATLYLPWGIAVAPDNSAVYIADGTSNNIRMVNLSTGQATRLAGGSKGALNLEPKS
jgi:DNA-binding beta-propeller fold protein YncE